MIAEPPPTDHDKIGASLASVLSRQRFVHKEIGHSLRPYAT